MTYTIQSLKVNPSLGTPLYIQVMEGIQAMIAGGVLKPGDQLPSVRELSSQLRINPSSTVKVYKELQRKGLISLDHGKGTFVSQKVKPQEGGRELLEKDLEALVQKGKQFGLAAEELEAMFRSALGGRSRRQA